MQTQASTDCGSLYCLGAQALASTSPGSEERFRARRLLPGMAKRLREVCQALHLAQPLHHDLPGWLLITLMSLRCLQHASWSSQRSIMSVECSVQFIIEVTCPAALTLSVEYPADVQNPPARAAGPRGAAAGGAGEGLWRLRGAAVARVRRHRRREVRRRRRAAVHCNRQREGALPRRSRCTFRSANIPTLLQHADRHVGLQSRRAASSFQANMRLRNSTRGV